MQSTRLQMLYRLVKQGAGKAAARDWVQKELRFIRLQDLALLEHAVMGIEQSSKVHSVEPIN